ncbi:hypothetical protein RJT34_15226 [Clitoria ternatea]|uniref:Uncharacterized protein n=1 Tax=Clitoria ternatea TaxID=43366 RepID=A0AAN9JS20_CLITE
MAHTRLRMVCVFLVTSLLLSQWLPISAHDDEGVLNKQTTALIVGHQFPLTQNNNSLILANQSMFNHNRKLASSDGKDKKDKKDKKKKKKKKDKDGHDDDDDDDDDSSANYNRISIFCTCILLCCYLLI